MLRALVAAGLCAALVGCQTNQAGPSQMWMRIDGKKSTGDPALEKEFYQARYDCQAQTVQLTQPSASVTQSVRIGPPPAGIDPSLMIAAGEASQRRQTADHLFSSCMNAKGYVLGTPPSG